MVRTPCFHCGPRFNPWPVKLDPTRCVAKQITKGGRENENFKSENNERKSNHKMLLSGFNLYFQDPWGGLFPKSLQLEHFCFLI